MALRKRSSAQEARREPRPIRVLVVDGSALIREILSTALAADPDIEVVGTAADPFAARRKIRELKPDVLTLDVDLPRMSGLEFLEKVMRARPMPIVMVTCHTAAGSEATLRALELGAVDYVSKPEADVRRTMEEVSRKVVEQVKAASISRARPAVQVERLQAMPLLRRAGGHSGIIAIGASTGGTEALKEVLVPLPGDCPPILIVQHMPVRFTPSLARRLDGICRFEVREARDGEEVRDGIALLAPGNQHMRLTRSDGGGYVVRLDQRESINHHRPSVDVLFDSVAEVVGPGAVGVLLTGMGSDGAHGLKRMRAAGASTIAQDEATCVVYGMPRVAVDIGAVDEVLPVDRIPARALALATGVHAMARGSA